MGNPTMTGDPKVRLGYLNVELPPVEDTSTRLLRNFERRWSGGSTLYHYTTLHGLLGIIQQNALWASHIGYLNDAEEVLHGRGLAREILERCHAKPKWGSFDSVIVRSLEQLNTARIPEFFVTSFSKLDDDLSQWRAYGDGVGISIAFDPRRPGSHFHIHLPTQALYADSRQEQAHNPLHYEIFL